MLHSDDLADAVPAAPHPPWEYPCDMIGGMHFIEAEIETNVKEFLHNPGQCPCFKFLFESLLQKSILISLLSKFSSFSHSHQ